jgi:hypothetical protein
MYMKPAQKIKRLLRMMVVREKQLRAAVHQDVWIHPPQEGRNFRMQIHLLLQTNHRRQRQRQVRHRNRKSPFIQWKKPTAAFMDKDGAVIKLPNIADDSLIIYLTLISNPPKFAVDSTLEKIVGMKTGTRV